MSNRKRDILTALCLSVFIITSAVCFVTFFKPLYYMDVDMLHISEYSGYAKDIILKNYDILIDYQSLFYQGELYLPDFRMSETGRIHFEEVKRIFEAVQILMISSFALSAGLIYRRHKEKEYRYLRLTSLFSVGIPAVLGVLACADFDRAFVIFHKIFFRNDYWIFDYYEDPIINVLPQDFFMHCFIAIIAIIIVLSTICYFIYRRYQKNVLKEIES